MNNERKTPDSLEDDIRKLNEAWSKATPVQRADRFIRAYMKLRGKGKNKDMDATFETWLQANALVALQTDALEEYFMETFALPAREYTEEEKKALLNDFYFEKDKDGTEHVVFRNRRKTTKRKKAEHTVA